MAVAYQEEIRSQRRTESRENILEREDYLSSDGKIMIPLGLSESGKLIVRDLSEIPHVLVCGLTGSGKTAFVRTLISIIITKQSPMDVKMVIYDAKRIDYSQFENVPHMLVPVITDRDKAIETLKFLAQESRNRFEHFAISGCKDFEKYNEMQQDVTEKLPEIFVVLDDFALLHMDRNETYEFMNVLRNGRIAGIHVIVVSSMASTKTLQKELISIIPCRICFRLTTKTESRAILEQTGAEELFVPGEMIYKFQSDLQRCQCVYATYDNIGNSLLSLKRNAVSVSSLGIEASMLFFGLNTNNNADYDEFISEAAELIINSQKASIGTLQRVFKIGFNRAARIMDQLEEIGVVSNEEGTKPRSILMTADSWNQECEVNGLKKIEKKVSDKPTNSSLRLSKQAANENSEPKVKLRDFAEIAVGESTISIHDHEIHYTKPVMTKLGEGNLTASFSGSNVIGLIYKKPSIFSPGYITFEFDSNINIKNENSYLLHADKNNISDVIKIEFGSGQDGVIKLLLQQLSEDIGVPIKSI